MYRKNKICSSGQKSAPGYQAETIEQEIRRMLNNKEPLEGQAPLIYTDRKDGVLKQFNIRTDKFEVAAEAMDKVSELHGVTREARIGERTYDTMTEDDQKKFNEKFPNNKHAQKAKESKT